MELKEYLTIHNIKMMEFAQLLQVHYQTIQCYILKTRVPSKRMAKRIEEMTCGLVKIEDMRGINGRKVRDARGRWKVS